MGRKRIAVFACAISFDNQSRIVQAIIKEANAQDMDVYIFTCHVNFRESAENKAGAFEIMRLPDLTTFDGVIILKNTIQEEQVAEDLVRRIQQSGIPAVCVDAHVKGMKYVGISNYDGQKAVVEYLIQKHQKKRISYVTGIAGNAESTERLAAYKDAMKAHGLICDDKSVFMGNYARESGREAVRFFMGQKDRQPDAIVFANDAMAIGGIEELQEMGYLVPEDIVVSGFDDDNIAQFYLPSLTTISRSQDQVGKLAVDALFLEQMDDVIVKTQVVTRESCGCRQEKGLSVKDLRRNFAKENLMMQQAVDAIKNMALELSGLESLGDFYDKLRPYVVCSDMKRFFLCMCSEDRTFGQEKEESTARIKEYTPKHYAEMSRIPLAYVDGRFAGGQVFRTAEVLPEEFRIQEKSTFYIVSPVYYQEICFGYTVSEGSMFALNSELAYSWTVNLGTALENIRKWLLMQRLMERMGSMWKYDMLTQVYNRSGFFYYAKDLLKKMKASGSKGFLMFFDLDGLKKINDTQGHEQGDRCIREMADVLRKVTRENELVMRYGGDEFVVFGLCREEKEVEVLARCVQEQVKNHNAEPDRSYVLAVSLGYSVHGYQELDNMEYLIEQADKKMYEEKRRKKTGRN